MMDIFGELDLPLVGCVALAAQVFVVREVVAGALRAAGQDLWRWIKDRSTR